MTTRTSRASRARPGRLKNCSRRARSVGAAWDSAWERTRVRLPSDRSPPISLPYCDSAPMRLSRSSWIWNAAPIR